SSHRAYFQVRSLELSAPHSLTAGSVVNAAVVGSGRTQVDVEVDLIQGTHSERLMHLHLTGNKLAFFDPRTQHGSDSVALTAETLSNFQPGPARLRAVATGCEQWTRLPPPTVRELEVELSSDKEAQKHKGSAYRFAHGDGRVSRAGCCYYYHRWGIDRDDTLSPPWSIGRGLNQKSSSLSLMKPS